MTHRQALREIHSHGFRIHAATSFDDGGMIYEARSGTTLARGVKQPSADLAMASCMRAVLQKVYYG